MFRHFTLKKCLVENLGLGILKGLRCPLLEINKGPVERGVLVHSLQPCIISTIIINQKSCGRKNMNLGFLKHVKILHTISKKILPYTRFHT